MGAVLLRLHGAGAILQEELAAFCIGNQWEEVCKNLAIERL